MADQAVAPFNDYDMNMVHVELEKLNIATDIINKMELQLDEARTVFRDIQNYWSQKLSGLNKKLKSHIEKSRPYHEARLSARNALIDAQLAAQKFERANSLHAVAKQQVALTQESLVRQQGTSSIDPACLEVLNHHIQRVNEAEKERLLTEEEHKRQSQRYDEANSFVLALEKELKRNISKSKPYFDANVEFIKVLEGQKALIQRLEAEIKQKKVDYANSLQRLEQMSEEIHLSRQLGKRDPGVGSETPDPPVYRESSLTGSSLQLGNNILLRKFVSEKECIDTLGKSKAIAIVVADGDDNGADRSVLDDTLFKPRSISEPVDPAKWAIQTPSTTDTDSSGQLSVKCIRAVPSISSGIILLAQQLSEYDKVLGGQQARIHAFTFPSDVAGGDCVYKTAPDGVKPFPTPPVTPCGPQTGAASAILTSQSFSALQNLPKVCLPETNSVTSASAADNQQSNSNVQASLRKSVSDYHFDQSASNASHALHSHPSRHPSVSNVADSEYDSDASSLSSFQFGASRGIAESITDASLIDDESILMAVKSPEQLMAEICLSSADQTNCTHAGPISSALPLGEGNVVRRPCDDYLAERSSGSGQE